MPSTATITAFYTFEANTKARATQVNNNFDAFRGHIIPIEVLTATAANLSYDLGSSEHRWRTIYNLDFDFQDTTTAGAFKVGGVEKFRVSDDGYLGSNANSPNLVSSAVANASTSTVTATDITTLACTITVSGFRPVMVWLDSPGTGTASSVDVQAATTTAQAAGVVNFRRGTTNLSAFDVANADLNTFTYTLIKVSPSSYMTIDLPPAGTHVYSTRLYVGQSGVTISVVNLRMRVMEL